MALRNDWSCVAVGCRLRPQIVFGPIGSPSLYQAGYSPVINEVAQLLKMAARIDAALRSFGGRWTRLVVYSLATSDIAVAQMAACCRSVIADGSTLRAGWSAAGIGAG